jgi:putative nucleotidyltransferase with HDIG domain
MGQERFQHIVDSLGQIPALPSVVSRLLQIINNPRANANAAANYIEKDVGLTSKVLKLANSAYYGIPNTINNIHSAVVLLGFDTIRSIVLSASVMKMFPTARNTPSIFDRRSLWKHNLETALIARILARRYSYLGVDSEAMFSAGLLHDIGKLVLHQSIGEEYEELLKKASSTARSLAEIEMEEFGIHHGQLGAMLLEKWAFPESLNQMVKGHHLDSEDIGEQEKLLFLANALSHMNGSGAFEGEVPSEFPPGFFVSLEIAAEGEEENVLEELKAEMAEEIENAEEFFALISE